LFAAAKTRGSWTAGDMQRRKAASRPRQRHGVLLTLLAATLLLLLVATPSRAGRDYYDVLGVPRDAHERTFEVLCCVSWPCHSLLTALALHVLAFVFFFSPSMCFLSSRVGCGCNCPLLGQLSCC